MNCHDCKENLDFYIDNELQSSLRSQFEVHVNECSRCREMIAREHEMRKALKSIPVPMPETGFFDQALARTVTITKRHEQNRWRLTAFGGAVAAGVVGWMILGQPMDTDTTGIDQAPIAGLSFTIGIPKTIRFSINSANELADARLFLSLPEGVEVVGFDMRSEIDWTTTIKKGPNILELPIVVYSGTGGTIFARVEHENKTKTFAFTISIT